MSVYIIAEAGVNHNGDIQVAKKMIDEAKVAGVDAIKFQTFIAENLVSSGAQKAEYQKENTNNETESQLEMVKKLELSFSAFTQLEQYCKEQSIQFLSTPFDKESISFLDKLEMPFWKIPSGEITNYPYLVQIGQTKKEVVMSTGMCDLSEIQDAIQVLKENGTPKITLLHCNTEYPTPMEDVNLNAMETLKSIFKTSVGYSDHTKGIEIPIAAVAKGAEIIEKHFTLDRNMEGPDHKASLEPQELKKMVESIRHVEKAMGSGEKKPSQSEIKNKEIARKSIVAAKTIKKGTLLNKTNLTTKRPGNGISPMRWEELMGEAAIRDFMKDECIEI